MEIKYLNTTLSSVNNLNHNLLGIILNINFFL